MSNRNNSKYKPLENERYCSWFVNNADVNQKDILLATDTWSLILNDTSPEFLAQQGLPGIPDSCIFWFYRCYERNIFLKDEDCDKSTIMLHSRFFISMITKLFDIAECTKRLIRRTLHDISLLFFEKKVTVAQFCILSESVLQSLGTCLGESFEVAIMTSFAKIFSFILKNIISKSNRGVKIIKYCAALNSIIRNVFFSPSNKYNKSNENNIDDYLDDSKSTKTKPTKKASGGGGILSERIRASSNHTNPLSTTVTVTSRSDPFARLAYSPINSPAKKTARSIIKMSSLDVSVHRETSGRDNGNINNNINDETTTNTTQYNTNSNISTSGECSKKSPTNTLNSSRIQRFNHQVVQVADEGFSKSISENGAKKSSLTSSFPATKAASASCDNIVRCFNPNDYEFTPHIIGRRNSNSPPNNQKLANELSTKSDFLFPHSAKIAVISEDMYDEVEDDDDMNSRLYTWEVSVGVAGGPVKRCHTPPVLQQRYEKYFGEYS